jgi:hypothetical protein
LADTSYGELVDVDEDLGFPRVLRLPNNMIVLIKKEDTQGINCKTSGVQFERNYNMMSKGDCTFDYCEIVEKPSGNSPSGNSLYKGPARSLYKGFARITADDYKLTGIYDKDGKKILQEKYNNNPKEL